MSNKYKKFYIVHPTVNTGCIIHSTEYIYYLDT